MHRVEIDSIDELTFLVHLPFVGFAFLVNLPLEVGIRRAMISTPGMGLRLNGRRERLFGISIAHCGVDVVS